jgi:uncharacterized membrane protein
MLRRKKTTAIQDNVASGTELATALARDKKFRRQLAAAIGHGESARRRAARRTGVVATAKRVALDEQLRADVREMADNLRRAWARVEKKRSHRLRNTLLVLVGGGAAAAVASRQDVRQKIAGAVPTSRFGTSTPRVIDESIEVNVPVSTAYNQWTQFEDFPLFMEGVDHVQQLDPTRVHWVATVGGRTAEWDAKILEQHPDTQISWLSEDGKQTRGTVTFEPLGDSRTLVRLSMSYRAEGIGEQLGSAAGLDSRRIRGDLDRFKELIESRGAETGAWRGEISAGTTESPTDA